MGRGDAHELIRKSSIIAYNKDVELFRILMENDCVSKLVGKGELEETMKSENYLGATEEIIDNIVKKLTR